MDPYSLKAIGERKIADDREWAARCRLADEADRARRERRQPTGSLLAGLFGTLASALGLSRPVVPAITQEPRTE